MTLFCFLRVRRENNQSFLPLIVIRKPFPRELIDKPNVLALELRDDESNSSPRHVW